jgi:hypothetical protein
MDWEELALTSHYHTAVAIQEALQADDVQEAMSGLEELIDALSRSEERALESHLIRLMQHMIKWKVQPDRRSPGWLATIREQRRQIRLLQRRHPRFTDTRIRETLWNDCYAGAVNEAEREMNQALPSPPLLSWEEVFDLPYTLYDSQPTSRA